MNCSTSFVAWIRRRTAIVRGSVALAAMLVGIGPTVQAQGLVPPPVPPGLEVLAPNQLFLIGHAVGTQNYECQPLDSLGPLGQVGWVLFTPEATLFDDLGNQVITHFFSPNPVEAKTVRATWQDSHDSSRVWARATASATVDPTAVAWLLLQSVGGAPGPTGGGTLADVTFVQRLNTVGGVAPETGCDHLNDVGHKAFMPYTADYLFYRK